MLLYYIPPYVVFNGCFQMLIVNHDIGLSPFQSLFKKNAGTCLFQSFPSVTITREYQLKATTQPDT